ncbi:MAG: hypothetical protein ACPL7O_05135, partial [Armatimonadota bacterium]
MSKLLQLVRREINVSWFLALDADVRVGDRTTLTAFLGCLFGWRVEPVSVVVVAGSMAPSGIVGRRGCRAVGRCSCLVERGGRVPR